MKILLINPPYFGIEDDHVEQNLGLAYLAAVLLKSNFKVDILELTGRQCLPECLVSIPYADLYGISCYTTTYKNVLEIIKYIKSQINDQAYIFLGGPHPSAYPEQTLLESGADLIIVGEGERAILHAVERFWNNQPQRGIICSELIHDLDEIPFPTRDCISNKPFSRTFLGDKTLSLIATRGCPYSCVHCNSNIMGGGSKGIRARSVANIISEIKQLKNNGIFSFRFNDDNFLAHPGIINLLKCLKKENIKFRVFGHLEYLTEEVAVLLKEAGCIFLSIGIESMNPHNLEFLGKLNNLKNISNLKHALANDLIVRASFMVGLPFDTDASIKQYFYEASMLDIQEFAVYPLIPYPGTKVEKYANDMHYKILNKEFETYVQMGRLGLASYCLSYDNHTTGIKFGPDDVRRWKIWAEELLSVHMIHMKDSNIAK